MKISIFGLGYVGAVSLACLARDGHSVTGVDIDVTKLELIRAGRSPIVEDGILQLMRHVVSTGRVTVTDSAAEAIDGSELSFVCVGTPSSSNGSQDLSALKRLCKQIGQSLKLKDDKHVVVIRSTVEPGTTERLVIPILEEESGKKSGQHFFVCFQPEFLREGTSIKDHDNPPMTIVGTNHAYGATCLKSVFGDLPGRFLETDLRTAESLKYACNAFHALKVTFANEIGRLCQALEADARDVMALLCEDKQLNISSAYLRPGYAFGGSCLPKDLRALLYLAKKFDVDVPMLSGVLPSNETHVRHAVEMILARGREPVAIIGLSFKSGTDDLRESPIVDLVESLIGKGIPVQIFDPEVRMSRLIGANRRYIDEVVPHLGSLMCESVGDAMRNASTVVIGIGSGDIVDQVCQHSRQDQFFVDLAGIPGIDRLAGDYRGICW